MLVDLLSVWLPRCEAWVLWLFGFIFPEYPKVGFAVFISAGLFFIYYLVRGKFVTALQMTVSTIVTLVFLLYILHWLIKLYRVMV